MNFNLRAKLLRLLPVSADQLDRLIRRSPHTYKEYDIPKRSGGVRHIAQPARGTKHLQYWLIENLFNELPIHDSASAYRKHASIRKNAHAHASNDYLVKFDFKNFFPSIKAQDIKKHLERHFNDKLTNEELDDIVRISCIKNNISNDYSLSIGAPCSPVLSNSIMYDFDSYISDWCKNNHFKYTRYADDLTFSTNKKGISSDIEPFILDVLKRVDYPSLKLNSKKTTYLSKKHQRRITGLILTNDGNVSIGRSKKRQISSMIHKFTIKQISPEDLGLLQGLIGFAKGVEPEFITRMSLKYGDEVLSSIFKFRVDI
jgi:RNA-directed DNA polymerase